jgi:Domain of unknown function (DUF4352)
MVMKKFLKYGIFAVIAIIIIGALVNGDDETSEPASSETSSSNSESSKDKEKSDEPETFGVGQDVPVGKLSYTVNEFTEETEVSHEYMGSLTTEGKFVIVDVTVKNNDSEARIIDSDMFRLLGNDGTEYSSNSEADLYINDDAGFFLTEVNPKMSKTGKIAFEVPSDESEFVLQVSSGFGWSGGEYNTIELK